MCSSRARLCGRDASQGEHPLDVVGQFPQALAVGAVATAAQQVHDHRSQEGKHGGTDAIGVAVGVLTKLRVAGPMPLVLNAPAVANQSQQGFWCGAQG